MMGAALAFLGTGTCHATPRNPSALALSVDGRVALIDCGGGCYHQIARLADRRFPAGAVSAVLLTHFHADHTAGLIDLIWGEMWAPGGPRGEPLTVAGPPGVGDFIEGRLLPFIGDYRVPFAITAAEMTPGAPRDFGFFTAAAHPLAHTDASCGYLIHAGGAKLAVTGDTGYCDALSALLTAADVAVIEWSMPGPSDSTEHMTPAAIEKLIAGDRLPKLAYVTHMYLGPGRTFDEQAEAHRRLLGDRAARFRFPRDLDVFDLP